VRRLLPVLVAGLLALAGLAALSIGTVQRTLWLPDDEVTATARIAGSAPVVITEPGVLELRNGPVRVTARSRGGTPVLLAVGRETDVKAWVGPAAHTRLTGLAGQGAFAVETTEGEPTVPDPAASDLWVQRETGGGRAAITYDREDGRWLLLAASDGTAAAPAEITMTWPREVSTPWSAPLIVAGVVLLLAAAALLGYLWWSGQAPFSPRGDADPATSVRSDEVRS
jgi:hypothetical protein